MKPETSHADTLWNWAVSLNLDDVTFLAKDGQIAEMTVCPWDLTEANKPSAGRKLVVLAACFTAGPGHLFDLFYFAHFLGRSLPGGHPVQRGHGAAGEAIQILAVFEPEGHQPGPEGTAVACGPSVGKRDDVLGAKPCWYDSIVSFLRDFYDGFSRVGYSECTWDWINADDPQLRESSYMSNPCHEEATCKQATFNRNE